MEEAPDTVERRQQYAPWGEIYIALHTLHAQGFPVVTIARQLGISRPTVYAYLRRTTPPGPKRPQFQWTARVLTPYVPTWLSLRAPRNPARPAQFHAHTALPPHDPAEPPLYPRPGGL